MKSAYRILFIVNPFSGKTKKKDFPRTVEEIFRGTSHEVSIVFTDYAGHAISLTEQASREGIDVVVAVGGDGTVNEVSRSLLGEETALAIIPAGSGNGLAMHLGLGRNIRKALMLLRNPQFSRIDCGEMNGKLFVNMAGTGIDALVAHNTSKNKLRGFINYLIGAVKESLFYQNQEYDVRVDSKERTGKFLSVNVANGSMFGYNFVVAPLADVQDGQLQCVLIHDAPKWKYILHIWRFFHRTIDRAPFAEILTGKSIVIRPKSKAYYHIDGDGYQLDEGNKLEFRVLPSALKVVVPRF